MDRLDEPSGSGMHDLSHPRVACRAGFLRITERHGPDVLDRKLFVLEEAWTRQGELLGRRQPDRRLGDLHGRHGHESATTGP
ncbi:MAG: hypothetical protein ACM3ZF_12010 [Mycobacterium leprae]